MHTTNVSHDTYMHRPPNAGRLLLCCKVLNLGCGERDLRTACLWAPDPKSLFVHGAEEEEHRYAQTLQATLQGRKRACITAPPVSSAPGMGNRIGDEGAVRLSGCLPEQLVSLDLLGNPIGTEGVKELLAEVRLA